MRFGRKEKAKCIFISMHYEVYEWLVFCRQIFDKACLIMMVAFLEVDFLGNRYTIA